MGSYSRQALCSQSQTFPILNALFEVVPDILQISSKTSSAILGISTWSMAENLNNAVNPLTEARVTALHLA
jgi:hypothetical protein